MCRFPKFVFLAMHSQSYSTFSPSWVYSNAQFILFQFSVKSNTILHMLLIYTITGNGRCG